MDTTASDLGEAQRDTILAQIKHQIDACKAKQKKSTSELTLKAFMKLRSNLVALSPSSKSTINSSW